MFKFSYFVCYFLTWVNSRKGGDVQRPPWAWGWGWGWGWAWAWACWC